MKIVVQKDSLLKSLAFCSSIVERKTTIPILSHVKLQVKGSNLNLSATDAYLEMEDKIECVVEKEGECTVSVTTLFDIIKKMPADNVNITNKASKLIVSSGAIVFNLVSLSIDEFPVFSNDQFNASIKIRADKLAEIIDSTRFSISTETTRRYLNGLYFHTEQDYLKLVSTDGHRLSYAKIKILDCNFAGIIVPRKTVAEIRKLIDGIDNEISMHISETRIKFVVGNIILTSRLLDGTFPDYNQFIPRDITNTLVVDRKNLISAVDRISIVSEVKNKSITMDINNNKLVVISSNSDYGDDAKEELDCSYSGKMNISFNSRYLLDILMHIDGDKVNFNINASVSPVIISNSEDLIYVLMPMRV